MATKDEVEKAKQILRDKPGKDDEGWMGMCTSYLSSKMPGGYNHAANIIAHLEAHGFLSTPSDGGHRRILEH